VGFGVFGGAGGFFPARCVPGVVGVGFARGEDSCGAYFSALDEALVREGFAAETKPFAAHVTVARVKEAARGDDWPGLARALSRDWPAFGVDSVVLWQSVLRPSGPEYRRVAEVRAFGPRTEKHELADFREALRRPDDELDVVCPKPGTGKFVHCSSRAFALKVSCRALRSG
jgi:hypothetical protein